MPFFSVVSFILILLVILEHKNYSSWLFFFDSTGEWKWIGRYISAERDRHTANKLHGHKPYDNGHDSALAHQRPRYKCGQSARHAQQDTRRSAARPVRWSFGHACTNWSAGRRFHQVSSLLLLLLSNVNWNIMNQITTYSQSAWKRHSRCTRLSVAVERQPLCFLFTEQSRPDRSQPNIATHGWPWGDTDSDEKRASERHVSGLLRHWLE